MQPTQPGLGRRARRTVGGQPHRGPTRRSACTAETASTPDTIAGASNATCPSRRCSLHLGAVLEVLRLDRRQRHDRGVLHRPRHVDHPLRRRDDRRPLRPRATGPRRRRHRDQAGLGGRKDLEQLAGRPGPTLRLRRLELHHCPLSLPEILEVTTDRPRQTARRNDCAATIFTTSDRAQSRSFAHFVLATVPLHQSW